LRSLRRDTVGGGDADGDEYAGIDIVELKEDSAGQESVSSSDSLGAVVRRIVFKSAL
jgi:hypothetical protein